MQQIKIFKGIESELTTLEREVNQWLVESQARVLHIFGNLTPQSIPPTAKGSGLSTSEFAPSDALIVIFYEKPM